MNNHLVEQAGGGTAAQRQKQIPSTVELTLEELDQATGKHVILQAEIDQKIAAHIVEIRGALHTTQIEVQSLRGQMDQLVRGFAQTLESMVSQQLHALQTNLAESSSSDSPKS